MVSGKEGCVFSSGMGACGAGDWAQAVMLVSSSE